MYIDADLGHLSAAQMNHAVGDFERFLVFFREAGYDLAAADAFIAMIEDQRQAEPYIEAIRAARG